MTHWLEDITLEGKHVSLRPLIRQHRQALLDAAADGNLWELWYTSVPNEQRIDAYLEQALSDREKGSALPFVVVDNLSGDIVGTTRYCNAVPEHRRLEIGYTWYARRCQRTAVNTECKALLLGHAFEHLDAIAVEFRTHWHNRASRAAIARLGARQDGVLRNHRIEPDGTPRDTVVFSIIQGEWPSVKKALAHRLARG
ncbi:GNAT family protein [Gallaecimonas sp. GXIMD4217]|uniref:GNAT family N-acetyltransferase n=1 Tax=Gallaecimonas sp. GXIMD4217 TaxID=3131927 RepID=UPI00311B0CFA